MNNDINIQFKLALRYAINSDLDKNHPFYGYTQVLKP